MEILDTVCEVMMGEEDDNDDDDDDDDDEEEDADDEDGLDDEGMLLNYVSLLTSIFSVKVSLN